MTHIKNKTPTHENHQLDGGGRRKGYEKRKFQLITIILLLSINNNITLCSGERELVLSLIENIGQEATVFYIVTLAAIMCRYIYLAAVKDNSVDLSDLITDNEFIR